MEHQTNSFISTTQSVLMAHEYAHQWFGDMVTCGSWQELWLNEGFATYCGTALFPEYVAPAYYKPYLQSIFNSAVSQPNGSVFVTDTADVNRLFSSRLTYNKGAYVLHMLRGVLGDSTFFRGVRRYLNDPAIRFGYARTADLRRNLELESGRDLSVFFQKWIYGEGYPNYHAEWTQNSNNWVKVKLNQTPSHSSVNFFEMPVTLNFKGQSEQLSFVVDHRFSGQEFWLNVGFPVDTLMIDPDQWILSKIKTSVKIAETNISNDIKIYPNPVKVDLVISLVNPSDKKLQIQLFNAAGQSIYQQQVDTPGRDELFKIPFSYFPKGVYWLKINSEKKIKMVRKIVR
jgi:hypothetical protein